MQSKMKANEVAATLLIFGFGLEVLPVEATEIKLNIHADESARIGELKHFWKSTGFCPPKPHNASSKFDLGDDMVKNVALIGTVPQRGIEQVRIHWLFELIKVEKMVNGTPVYNFTDLDSLIDLLYENGLKPGFELMGNPGSMFTDFDERTDVMMWRDLVKQVAQRYVDEYGLGYVSEWNFETWNEPDCHDFDNLKISVQGFLNYYDACSEGLLAVSLLLKLGGPGDGCKSTKYADALLHHVVNGVNYFTGEKGVRLDFISFHRKGGGTSDRIIRDEIELMKLIKQAYPSLASKPFYNDEADPLVGWSKDEVWRADATYAAIVAKIITQHQKAFISNSSPMIQNYSLLSNDNAFLSWYPHQFTQRTLLARFQINTTSPPHTQFFQKPVHSVMGMLALLGEMEIKTELTGLDLYKGQLDALGSIHVPETNNTADSWQFSTLVYFSNDTVSNQGVVKLDIFADIQPPECVSQDFVIAFWLCDNYISNPYGLWQKAEKPPYPDRNLIKLMRGQEGAKLLYTQKQTIGSGKIASIALNEPSVLLIHGCSKPAFPPNQVTNVAIYNITSGQILITWSDNCVDSRCILKYEVVFSKTGDADTYQTVTPDNRYKHATFFVYAPDPVAGTSVDDQVQGYYKVRAVDYFSNQGQYSLPTKYLDDGTSLDNQVQGYYKVRAVDYFSNQGQYSLPTKYPDDGKLRKFTNSCQNRH